MKSTTVIHGETDADRIEDGIEFRTDREFDLSKRNVEVELTTALGRRYLIDLPEDDPAASAMMTLLGIGQVATPIERVGPKHFRLRMTDSVAAIIDRVDA